MHLITSYPITYVHNPTTPENPPEIIGQFSVFEEN